MGQDWEHANPIAPIELVQCDKTIRLSGKQIKTLPFLHAPGAPDLTERALVFFQGDGTLDPCQPWQVRLLVEGEATNGQRSFADFTLPDKLPDTYLLKPATEDAVSDPAAADTSLPCQAIWRAHNVKIGILGVALVLLTAILFLQQQISRSPRPARSAWPAGPPCRSAQGRR